MNFRSKLFLILVILFSKLLFQNISILYANSLVIEEKNIKYENQVPEKELRASEFYRPSIDIQEFFFIKELPDLLNCMGCASDSQKKKLLQAIILLPDLTHPIVLERPGDWFFESIMHFSFKIKSKLSLQIRFQKQIQNLSSGDERDFYLDFRNEGSIVLPIEFIFNNSIKITRYFEFTYKLPDFVRNYKRTESISRDWIQINFDALYGAAFLSTIDNQGRKGDSKSLPVITGTLELNLKWFL